MTTKASPKISLMIKNDYVTLAFLLVPLLLLIAEIVLLFNGKIPSLRGRNEIIYTPTLGNFLIGIACVFILLFVSRILSIKKHFANGIDVKGTIQSIYFFRDRGRISFTYTYENQQYTKGNAVHKTQDTTIYRQGDEVDLTLNPDKPNKVLIKSLFIEKTLI